MKLAAHTEKKLWSAVFLEFCCLSKPKADLKCSYWKNAESDEEEEEEGEPMMKVDFEESQKNKRLEKKRRLKERFDTEYDDGDATYFDDLKEEMQKQAEVLWAVYRIHTLH